MTNDGNGRPSDSADDTITVTPRDAAVDDTAAVHVDEPDDTADVAAVEDGEPEPAYDDGDEIYDERPRRVVSIPRGVFAAGLAFVTLLVLGLGVATGWLWYDRSHQKTPDPVVATVNGEQIRRSEYDKAVARGEGAQVLDTLVTERLIESEARKRGITIDQAENDRLLNDQKSRFGSDAEFTAALQQNGITESDLRERIRTNELLRRLVGDKISVSEEEITARFDQAKDQNGQIGGQTLTVLHDQIRDAIEREKLNNTVPQFLEDLRAGAKIETKVPGATPG